MGKLVRLNHLNQMKWSLAPPPHHLLRSRIRRECAKWAGMLSSSHMTDPLPATERMPYWECCQGLTGISSTCAADSPKATDQQLSSHSSANSSPITTLLMCRSTSGVMALAFFGGGVQFCVTEQNVCPTASDSRRPQPAPGFVFRSSQTVKFAGRSPTLMMQKSNHKAKTPWLKMGNVILSTWIDVCPTLHSTFGMHQLGDVNV